MRQRVLPLEKVQLPAAEERSGPRYYLSVATSASGFHDCRWQHRPLIAEARSIYLDYSQICSPTRRA